MSAHLKISRSQLSMIEIGRRSLSAERLTDLADLQQHMLAGTSGGKITHEKFIELLADQQKKKESLVSYEMLNHQHKLQTIRRRMMKLKDNQEHCRKIFEQLDNLEKTIKKKDKDLLSMICSQAKELQHLNGEDTLFKLELQAVALEAVHKFLDGYGKTVVNEPEVIRTKSKPKQKPKTQPGQLNLPL